jgi:hypothetical protein
MPNQNTIPVATAAIWTSRWRASNRELQLNGFLIPGVDLTEVLAERGVVNVRTYLGIDDSEAYHLLIVGVDVNGNDMVDEDLGQYVYDFTSPCPPMCGAPSPLNS